MTTDAHQHARENGYSWVATTLSQTCVGFLTAEAIEDDFYVGEISVEEAHQKKGIGSRLFDYAFTEAKSLGFKTTTLTTFKDVPWNAPYYERLGFVILQPYALPSYLQTILHKQAAAGLPLERRCAMRKRL